jgi:hypothetical protein
MAAAQGKLVSKTLRYSLYNHLSGGKKGNFSNLSVFLQYAYFFFFCPKVQVAETTFEF